MINEAAIEQQVPPDSPILNQIAAAVPADAIKTAPVQELINKMFRIAHGRQGDASRPTLVGLAAPQIGVSQRIVIIGVDAIGNGEPPTLEVFINPVITSRSDETEDGREGCFSTGKVCGIVSRAARVTVHAYDREGRAVERTLEGFPARVAQHEIDHLDGIRFPDRITDDHKLHWVEPAEFGEYRIHWRDWPQHCDRTTWERIKAGK